MSRVSRNIIYNLLGQSLIVALGFWGTRLVFHRLGAEALGILYFALAIHAVLTPLLDLGVSSMVVREVASHRYTDPDYVVRLARTGTLFYWSTYALLAAGIWLTAPWLVSHWITLKLLDFSMAVHALRVLAVSLLLMLPRSLYGNLLRGVERMGFNNLIEAGTTVLQQGGTVVVAARGGGLVEIAYFYLVSLLLSNLVYIVIAARLFGWSAVFPAFSTDVVQRNYVFTSHMAAFMFLAMIQMESDKALVSKLLPVGVLGYYGVAQTMVARISRVPGAVTQAALPNFSALSHKGDRAGLIREYRKLQDLVCYGLVPIFAAIIFACPLLFSYLLSAQAAQILLAPTALLALGFYMNGTISVPFVLSLAMGRADISVKLNFYALFLVLPITATLIWKLGLVGAGLSSVFYHLYVYSYAVPQWASQCIGIRPFDWYSHVAKILMLAGATYGTTWLGLTLNGQTSIAILCLAYGLASVAYLYGAYLTMGVELRDGFINWRLRMASCVPRYISLD